MMETLKQAAVAEPKYELKVPVPPGIADYAPKPGEPASEELITRKAVRDLAFILGGAGIAGMVIRALKRERSDVIMERLRQEQLHRRGRLLLPPRLRKQAGNEGISDEELKKLLETHIKVRPVEAGYAGRALREVGREAKKLLETAIIGPARLAKKVYREAVTPTEPADLWWYIPAAALGGGGALYGGYKFIDKLLEWRKRKQLAKERAKAEKRFREALLAEHEAGKTAEWNPNNGIALISHLYATGQLEPCIEKTEKRAGALKGIVPKGKGLYLLLAALLGGGAYFSAKHYLDARDPMRKKLKALQLQLKARSMQQSPAGRLNVAELTALEGRKKKKKKKKRREISGPIVEE